MAVISNTCRRPSVSRLSHLLASSIQLQERSVGGFRELTTLTQRCRSGTQQACFLEPFYGRWSMRVDVGDWGLLEGFICRSQISSYFSSSWRSILRTWSALCLLLGSMARLQAGFWFHACWWIASLCDISLPFFPLRIVYLVCLWLSST